MAVPRCCTLRRRHEAVVKLLVARDDVEVDSKDEAGRSPLSYAAENGHEAVVKILVARDNVEVDSSEVDSKDPKAPA